MILLSSLALVEVFLLLCAKPFRKFPGLFYGAAALISAAVTGLYWAAPDGISPAMLNNFPLWLGAFGTACFIEVMVVGALPNGHPLMKRNMPVRGELSIFACLLTLGQNLSYGKNYFTPGYLFTGPISATKAAAWVSVVMIILMLVLTVTSIKAVRRKFSPKRWKVLQRWAYLFYGLIYIHVLLMNVPGFLKGRARCGWTLLAYSVVFLYYGICRVRKALLRRGGHPAKLTGTSQLAAAGIGAVLSLILVAGLYLSIPEAASVPVVSQGTETISPISEEQSDGLKPEAESTPEPEPTPEKEEEPEEQEITPVTDTSEPDDPPAEDTAPEPETVEASEPIPAPAAEPAAEPEHEPEPEIPSTQEPEAEVSDPDPEPEPEPEAEPVLKYQNGTFTGSGEGYYGKITVSVTISDDVITSISIDSYMDDDDYFGDVQSGVVSAILSTQSPDVSAVSGATYSSKGIMAAVRDALAKAENG